MKLRGIAAMAALADLAGAVHELNTVRSRAFSGKRIRQDKAKLAQIRKRDRRLRKVTKGKYSILSFQS